MTADLIQDYTLCFFAFWATLSQGLALWASFRDRILFECIHRTVVLVGLVGITYRWIWVMYKFGDIEIPWLTEMSLVCVLFGLTLASAYRLTQVTVLMPGSKTIPFDSTIH